MKLNNLKLTDHPFKHWEFSNSLDDLTLNEISYSMIPEGERAYDGTRAADHSGKGLDGKLRLFITKENCKEFQNLTDVIVIELLKPNIKIKSKSYNNHQEEKNNKSIFAIANSTNQKIKLDWIDFNGNLQSRGYINAKDIREHESFNGHAFQSSNAKTNEILNHFIVPKGKGIVMIK